jgi:hypothetical protein
MGYENIEKPIEDPFLGKCIHGNKGAVFVKGNLTNPHCEHCTPNRLQDELTSLLTYHRR